MKSTPLMMLSSLNVMEAIEVSFDVGSTLNWFIKLRAVAIGGRMVAMSVSPLSKRSSFLFVYFGLLMKEMVPNGVWSDVPSESMSSLYSSSHFFFVGEQCDIGMIALSFLCDGYLHGIDSLQHVVV